MPQLSYSQDAVPAQAGMFIDSDSFSRDVVSLTAGVNIPFGVMCTVNASGLLVPVQDATTGGAFVPALAGISVFDPLGVEMQYGTFQVPATSTGSSSVGYLKGMSVPVLRRGRVWVLGDATGTATRTGAINVHHSSTGANPQGVFTFSAVSATAGNEIDIAPYCNVWNPSLIGGTAGPSFTDPFGNVYKVYPVEIQV